MFFFFFSSRRRHTRSKRDWSSDVCSSDLQGKRVALVIVVRLVERERVVDVELEPRIEHAPQAYGDCVVTRLRAAFAGPQSTDVKGPAGREPAERIAERRIVAVDKPGQVIA